MICVFGTTYSYDENYHITISIWFIGWVISSILIIIELPFTQPKK